MPDTVFQCPTPNCPYAIDATGKNKIQLEALRRWAKTCPSCGKSAKFMEQTSLPNIQITQTMPMEGKSHANTNQVHTKTASQKRKAARHNGLH